MAKKATKASSKAPAAKAKPAAKKAPAKAAKPDKAPKAEKAAKVVAAPPAKTAPAAAKKPAGKATAVPAGHHTVTPHLVVRGAASAIDFYKHAFGAVEVMRMPGPDGFSIMHAEITIGDSHVYLADEMPDMGDKAPQTLNGTSVGIHLYVENADAVIKKAEEHGAKVIMPAADMFWGDRFGKIADPFGHSWSIATHKEDVPLAEMGKRAGEFFKNLPKPPQ